MYSDIYIYNVFFHLLGHINHYFFFSFTSACLQIVFMSFLKFSQQTPIISLRQINRILLVMDMKVGTELL